jgi:hypothetical protein
MRGITSRGPSGAHFPGPLLDRPRPGLHPPFPGRATIAPVHYFGHNASSLTMARQYSSSPPGSVGDGGHLKPCPHGLVDSRENLSSAKRHYER